MDKTVEMNENISEVDEIMSDGDVDKESEEGPPRKKKKRNSWIWKHFTCQTSEIDGHEYAHCNYCTNKYKLSEKSNGSTGNCNSHLKKKHPDRISLDPQNKEEDFVFSQERFREALLKWIVVSNQPFTEAQQKEFVEMVNLLNPAADLISDKTVKRDLMAKYLEKVEELKLIISEVPGKFSFTVDAWTSKNIYPFMAIRAHWISKDWELRSALLDLSYIDGQHSGSNLSDIFMECMQRFNIPLAKVMSITPDNASNNDTFIESLEDLAEKLGIPFNSANNRVRCMAHILNLSVQDILAIVKIPVNELDTEIDSQDLPEPDLDVNYEDSDSNPENIVQNDESNQTTVEKLRKLVRKIRKSAQMRQKLKRLCLLYQMDYLTPILDVKTRWNSTYAMIVRAAKLKTPLRAMCSNEKELQPLALEDAEYKELEVLGTLLQKFDRAYKYEEELQLENSSLPYIALFLNPALKMNYFKDHNYNKNKIKDIQKVICGTFERDYQSKVNSDDKDRQEEESRDEFHLHMFKKAKVNREPKEFQKYIQFPLSSSKVNTLDYWRSQQADLPNLSRMARDVLAVQSSSVAVERDFSDGSHLVTQERCSLLPETIRACLCLKNWFKNGF